MWLLAVACIWCNGERWMKRNYSWSLRKSSPRKCEWPDRYKWLLKCHPPQNRPGVTPPLTTASETGGNWRSRQVLNFGQKCRFLILQIGIMDVCLEAAQFECWFSPQTWLQKLHASCLIVAGKPCEAFIQVRWEICGKAAWLDMQNNGTLANKATLQFITKSNLGASKDCRPTKWTYSLSAKAVKRKHGDARWWSIWEMSQFPSRHLSTSSCVASDLAQGGPDMTDDDFGRPLNSSHLMPSNSGPSISQANRLVSLPKDEQMTCIHPQFGWFYNVLSQFGWI